METENNTPFWFSRNCLEPGQMRFGISALYEVICRICNGGCLGEGQAKGRLASKEAFRKYLLANGWMYDSEGWRHKRCLK